MMRQRSGYTIYLVLVIGSIFSMLFIVALLATGSESRLVSAETRKIQAKLLAKSGIIRAEYFMSGAEGHSISWETPRFEEPVMDFGSITLAVERFGLFSRVVSTGIRRGTSCAVIGLIGRTPPKPLETTLTVTGHVGGLVLKNGSMIEGPIALHHGFVYDKKGGKALVDYTRRLSLRESPALPFDTLLLPALIKQYKDRDTALLKKPDEARGMTANTASGAIDSSFSRKLLVVNGDYRIATGMLDDVEMAISGTFSIGSAARLRNVVCYADKIVCEGGVTAASLFFSERTICIQGGSHNSQFFACDSIVVKKNASFGQMSVIACYREAREKDSLKRVTGGVFVDDEAALHGAIICADAPNASRGNTAPSVTLGKNAVMAGWIITDGDCFLSENTITGSLWLRSILSRDPEGAYIDYLIKTKIKRETGKTPFPLIGDAPVQLMVPTENLKYGKLPPSRAAVR